MPHESILSLWTFARGRQCAFMSLSALLCANSSDILTWTTETIDGILIEGDVMYLKAFEERSIPDEETISLNYLPDRVLSSTIRTAIETEPKHNQTIDLYQQPNMANTYQNEAPNAAQNRKQTSNETNTYQKELPNAAQNQKLTPNMVKNTDLPIMAEANEPQSNSLVTNIKYKDFYQGSIIALDQQNDSPYVDLQTALMNTFTSDNYAFIILDGYI